MKKVIIVYGSTTGNAEKMAKLIAGVVKETAEEVAIQNVYETEPSELFAYDIILLGSSTWGDGVLQDDFIGFEDNMKQIKLSGKKGACFGPGDRMYPQFCKAVDVLEMRLQMCGATILAEGLKIDGDIEDC